MDSNGDGQFYPGRVINTALWSSRLDNLVGDWNGDGKSEIGIYKDTVWYLDYGGSGVIDATTRYYQFGLQAGRPLLETGIGIKKIRLASTRTATGIWITMEMVRIQPGAIPHTHSAERPAGHLWLETGTAME